MGAAAGRPESQVLLQEPRVDANGHRKPGWKPGHRWKCKTSTVALAITLVIVSSAFVVTVPSVSLSGHSPAVQGPACPDGWVGCQGKCYYFSTAEGNWTYSQNNCSALGAFLAGIDTLQKLPVSPRYKGEHHHWTGLRRVPGKPWKWINGTEFHNQFPIAEDGYYAYVNEKGVSSLRCTSERCWICSKSDAFTKAKEATVEGGLIT